MADERSLYRPEFYILWDCGFKDEELPEDVVIVCVVSRNGGKQCQSILFHSEADAEERADEKFLEWISNGPVLDGDDLNIKLYMNYSPLASFSKPFSQFVMSLQEEERKVKVSMKVVKLRRVDGEDEEEEENREGLREMKKAGISISSVCCPDWHYLREILIDREGCEKQETNCKSVKKQLKHIFTNPKDVEMNTELETAEVEVMTELETADAEVMTDPIEEPEPEPEPEPEHSSSSSSDEE